jgi:hypothetical protein
LNYTSTIPTRRTVAEVQQLLVDAGARSIRLDYDAGGDPVALAFVIPDPRGPAPYRLPVRTAGVLRLLGRTSRQYGKPDRYGQRRRLLPESWVTEEHALRVAWRQVKDWLEAQLALVAAEMVTLDEVMLPYALVEGERTLYDAWREHRALPSPGAPGG